MPITNISDLDHAPDATSIVARTLDIHQDFHIHLEKKAPDHRSDGVHASEICTCERQVGYTLTQTLRKPTPSSDMMKRFGVGHAVHGWIQKELHDMSAVSLKQQEHPRFMFESEVRTDDTPLGKQLLISSSCDGIITVVNNYDEPIYRIGLEIKTEAPDSFAKLNSPREKHITQAHVYMACFDLPMMWFLYFNKGNQNITPCRPPWLLAYRPAEWTRIESRIHSVFNTLEAGDFPEREEGYHCSWCPFAYVCEPKTEQRNKGSAAPVRISGRR